MQRYFQASFHALILAGFVAIGRTGRLDIFSVAIFAACFVVSANQAFRNRPPLVGVRGAFWLSLGYIGFFPLDALVLSGSFVAAVMHMILFLTGVKLAQDKRDKDYLHLILLSFLLVLAAASLTISMSFVFTLLLYVTALVSTLMSFEIYRSERSTPGSRAEGIGFRLGSMSVWVTGWILVVGVSLFFVVPRFGTGYFTRADSRSLMMSGFSGSVELGEIGRVKLNSRLVMRTRLIEGTPLAAPKWRGIALDSFDGRRWYTSNADRIAIPAIGGELHTVRTSDPARSQIDWEIFLEPLATPALFGPHVLGTVSGTFPGLELDANDSVFMRSPPDRRIRYEIGSYAPPRNPQDRPDEPGQTPGEGFDRYLQLPADLDPRVAALARSVTDRGTSTFEKASLIELYLKRNYDYSLSLDWDPGDQPLATFLFNAQTGHCEYFASSMAIMLRTVGIPTRLVNGFLPGEFNAVGGSYIVRQSDAHSWIEVWIPGHGWTEFDPTPPDPGDDFNMALLMAHYVDAFELFWNSYILTYDSGTQTLLLGSAREAMARLQSAFRGSFFQTMTGVETLSDSLFRAIGAILTGVAFWTLALVAVLAGCAIRYRSRIRVRWKLLRLRAGLAAPDSDIAAALFERAARLAGQDSRREPHQTWREWIGGLPEGRRQFLVRRALAIFEKASYGDENLTDEEFSILRQTVEEMRQTAIQARSFSVFSR